MNKYKIILSLLFLFSFSDTYSADVDSLVKEEKKSAVCSQPLLAQSVAFSLGKKLGEFVDFFDETAKKSEPLKSLGKNFNYVRYAHQFLRDFPQASNYTIMAEFIRYGAGTIIKSPEYRSKNKAWFHLVEALDPICWKFIRLSSKQK